MKSNNDITKLITAALLAALTCIATMFMQIPITGGGYIHPGDAFVLLSGILLGPIYGGLAGGIGSMLADLLSGYGVYEPATLIIKFLAAMIAAQSFRHIRKNSVILAGIFSGIIVTSGYFVFECFLSGKWAGALAALPFNLLQNLAAIIITLILLPLLKQVPQIRGLMEKPPVKLKY